MFRAAMVLVLVGACTGEVGTEIRAACDQSRDELLGCCAAGDACTWAAPVGDQCTDAFTSFCGHGLGWCEDSTCRAFCNPVESPRCGSGLVEHHAPLAELGDADQCLCVPE